MARFNQFLYSDEKYGTSPTTDLLLWSFIVAWSGEYTGENEANRMVDLTVRRGRDNMLSSTGFDPLGIGMAVGIVDNEDGRYDPLNASSPLYPNVSPGKLCEIAVKDGNEGTNYGVMQGVIDDIQPIDIRGKPHARIVVKDGSRWLQDKLTGATTLEGDTLQTIAEWIIDNVDSPWPISADDSTLMTTETKAFWWTWKRPTYQELQELADSEAGVFFHGRDGVFYLYNRDFTHNRTKAVTQAEILIDIAVPQPWEIIRNSVEVEYFLKSIEDLDDPGGVPRSNLLWQGVIGSPSFIDLPQYETITIDATFKYRDYRMAGYNERLVFVAYDDDMVTQITDSCIRTWDDPVGGGTRISVFNNSNLGDGYISGIEFDGDVLYASYKSSRSAEDISSQAKYGGRSLKVGGFWTELPDTALAIADWLLADLKDPTLHPIIQFEARADYQFFFDLWDRVELSIAKKSISDNFRVGAIEHQWLNPTGQAVRTTMKLEPYLTVFS